jgi:hypothetical protein
LAKYNKHGHLVWQIKPRKRLYQLLFSGNVHNPVALHNDMMTAIRSLLKELENFPPLVVAGEVISAKDWLKSQNIDINA